MGLGQEVHTGESGVALPDLGQYRPGGVGQDGLAEVGGPQQGEVVAPGQAAHPGELKSSRHVTVGSVAPLLVSSARLACDLAGRVAMVATW